MRKKGNRKNRTFRSVIIAIVAITAIYTFLPDYLQKGLIYFTPDIDDYKIFDNREVKTGTPVSWPVSERYNNIDLPSTLNDSLEKYQTVSFLVIQNDSLLFERYWNGHSETAVSNSFSMAKSIVSLLVGCAIDDGYIKSLDEKVKPHLPWLNGPHSEQLTIRHLLTMSSGSSWDESYSSPFSITTQAYYGRNLNKTIRKVEIINHPGIVFKYRSGDTQIIERLLHKVTGMNVSEYASKKLWQPLRAEVPALWSLDKKEGIEKAYCCFNSNARDFARIGNLVLNEGEFRDTRIVSANYIEEMIQPVSYLTDEDAKMVDYYGLSWWLVEYNNMKIPYARGILGQYIFVIPKYNAVVVRLGHKRSNTYRLHHPTDVYTWLNTAFTILEDN
ncbi:MAG: hypothetical protein PWQ17_2294 [Anaerophaga sp.]|nr:hypothetical protein [Anaerophaga sp.]MDN5292590.1 hypothetical protein [Anaerophaga sp.]